MNFAFISRHKPTAEQMLLAAAKGISLYPIGDTDAFTIDASYVHNAARDPSVNCLGFDGVIVVHPAAAMRLCDDFIIGVFENANRAPEGAPPQFSAKALHLYDATHTEAWN